MLPLCMLLRVRADLIIHAHVTPTRKTDWWSGRALTARVIEGGGLRSSQVTSDWDIARKCENPIQREVFARPPGSPDVVVGRWRKHPFRVRIMVECRRCNQCLRRRARLWWARAMAETAIAPRTWFVTWTLRPEEQYRALILGGTERRSEEEEWDIRHRQISKWITLAVKRLRKQTGATIRLLCVAEAHASGLPHYHLLVHEVQGVVRERDLTACWPHGFSKSRLVADPRAAAYVTKYLSKSMRARVRASIDYGNTTAYAIGLVRGARATEDVSSDRGEEQKKSHKSYSLEETFAANIEGETDGISNGLSKGCKRPKGETGGLSEAGE